MAMKWLNRVIAAVMLLVWLPATSLCLIERAGWLANDDCCPSSTGGAPDKQPASNSTCCTLASGSYKAERRACSITTQIHRKDASSFWSELSLYPVCDNTGKVAHFIWFLNDITERHQAEEARARLESQLQRAQKMEALGTLAGGIAHDFNNILGAIIGYSHLIRSDLPDASVPKENIGKVIKAAHRARDLVRQILAFSRQAAPERKPVRLAALINETLSLLRAGLPATIEIRRDLRAGNDSVLADPSQLHQVLMNLCTNAGHAMRERGGTITVLLDTVEADPTTIGTLPSLPASPCLRLSVSDTGHGIPPEILERIFEPFFTTKPVGEGTGLGLSVAQGIIKNHGGDITVTSQPGSGTTFHIFLPQAPNASDSAHETTILRAKGGNEHILFVDDEEALVDIATQRLARLGYRVTTFTDSQAALEAIKTSSATFDALVTDQTMPTLTGLALAREARQRRPDLPIFICTGYSETLHASELSALGRCETVMKPMDPDSMSVALRRALDAGKAQSGFSSAKQP